MRPKISVKDVNTVKFCDINGISFSRIVMGSCYFGTKISERDSFEMLDYYFAHGGNVVDTAYSYANWLPGGEQASERTVGGWMRSSGVRPLLVTKAGLVERGGGDCKACLTPENLRSEIEKSLDVLGVSRVDAWLLHRDDRRIPVGEIVDICDEFVRDGKTRLIGVSNWDPDRIAEANLWAEKHGKTKFALSQILWSAAQITREQWGDTTLSAMDPESRRFYIDAKMPVMAFSSQAKGFFSKGFRSLDDITGPARERFLDNRNAERLETMRRICRENGVSPAAAALAYVTSNPVDGLAIVGCSRLSQLSDSMSAPDFVMSPADIAELER